MTFKLLDRTRMSVSGAAGTGDVTLNAAALGFQTFDAAGMMDGDSTTYVIDDGDPVGSAWEIGVGTWHSNNTLTRDTVIVSSAGGTTKISVTSTAIVNAGCRANDLTPSELSSLQDVGITTPSHDQILRYNGSTSKWENNSSVFPAFFVQAAGGIITSAGTLSITLGTTPTEGNLLVGFAKGAVSWSGWDYSVINGDMSYAFRGVRLGDGAATDTIVSSGAYGVAGIAEVSHVDLTRFGPQLVNQLAATVASNPTTISQSQLSIDGALHLYFYGGPDVTLSRTGAGVSDDAAGGDTTHRYVMAHNTSVGGLDSTSTVVHGTGDVLIQTMSLTGYVP